MESLDQKTSQQQKNNKLAVLRYLLVRALGRGSMHSTSNTPQFEPYRDTPEADVVEGNFLEELSSPAGQYVQSRLAPLSPREERIHQQRLAVFSQSRIGGEELAGLRRPSSL